MPNPTLLTLGQAAKEVGLSKPTISEAIKKGRLSATKDGNQYQIDPAELFRVWPKGTRNETPETVGPALVQQAVLEVKLEASERDNERLRTDKRKLESLLDDAHSQRDIRQGELETEKAKTAQFMLGYEREKAASFKQKKSAFAPWILALIVIALAGLLADRFGLISLLDLAWVSRVTM